ncbi:MAG: iron-containing alcohol dehydrogenase, partial [Promethearchaeota archaeon]
MWYWYSPTIIFGEDSLEYLEKVDGKKVFIVTDPGIMKVGLINLLTDKLKEYGKEWKIFSDVEPDPKEETIMRSVDLCRDYTPDIIIALGGGSSMDTAKATWVFYERPDLTVDDIHPFQKLDLGKKAKLIAIPTTSGTGSETTWVAVITRIEEDGTPIKLEQANKEIIPNLAILDPVFVKTLPPKLTAATGFDALSHALEGLISTWKNDFSDAASYKAVDLIRKYLPVVYKDGSNIEARTKMMIAASLAGLSFSNSQVILGHSLGHALGSAFHIPHGLAVGVFLPYALEYCMNDPDNDETKKILGEFAKSLNIADWKDNDDDAAKKLIDDIKDLQKKIDFPASIKELGISKEDLEAKKDLIARLCMESSVAVMSPRSAGTDDFKKILDYAFEGK